MQTTPLALLASTALLLAACGGSGGDTPQNTDSAANTEPAAQWHTFPAQNAPYQGIAATLPANTSAIANANHLKAIATPDLNTLHVDGKQIALQIPGLNSRQMTVIQNSNVFGKSYTLFIVSGSKYAHNKFGYLNDAGKDYIFSQGALTANMPASGRVKYDGEAAIGRNGQFAVADAEFTADFAAKTLTGKIEPEDRGFPFAPISIQANIEGSSFASAPQSNVRTTGHFYGPNAAELGGIFYDANQQISGSFGAKIDR